MNLLAILPKVSFYDVVYVKDSQYKYSVMSRTVMFMSFYLVYVGVRHKGNGQARTLDLWISSRWH